MFFWISSAKASVRKAPTTPDLQCFFPTKDKAGLFTMISHPGSRKIEPTHWLQQRKSQRSKLRTCPTVLLDHLFKNTGIYNVLRKHMHTTPQIPTYSKLQFPWQQAKTSKNIDNCSVSGQWQGRQEENID